MAKKKEVEDVEEGRESEAETMSGSDGGSSYGDDGTVDSVVDTAMKSLVALDPDDLDTAMIELKKKMLTFQYMANLNKIVADIMAYDGTDDNPFPKAERKALTALFSRSSVLQHTVFKDNEWTLGPRREPCGANTTIELLNKTEDMSVAMCFEWYWRNDDEEGFVEDYTFSIEDDGEEGGEGGGGSERDSESGEHVTYATFLEGTRSQRGQSSIKVNNEILEQVETTVLKTGASLQSLLRFLVLCTRFESRKCQGRAGSVTAGYNTVEDAESMRKFLCEFTCEGGAGKPAKVTKAAGAGGGKVGGKRGAAVGNGKGPAGWKKAKSS